MFETIGPVWDGNEVWLVIAGAATFAAFPGWYGTMFSGLYLALLLVLVLLIVRVVSFEWRDKRESSRWRATWMWANTIGSIGAPLIWGVGLSNLVHGLPIDSDGHFAGSFWDLFSPYTVFAGLAAVLLFAFHGATFLTLRTTGDLLERARHASRRLALPAALVSGAFLAWTVAVAVDRNEKDVFPPILPAAVGIVALLLAVAFTFSGRSGWAFGMTGAGDGRCSWRRSSRASTRASWSRSRTSRNSLTVDGTASSHYALTVMTVAALILAPLILLYQGWTYHVFRARIGVEEQAASPVDLIARKTEG